MRTLGFIPARGGSKGIPLKNLFPLAGRPLIDYTILAALKAGLDETIVSTDSLQIAEHSKSLGAQVPFLRPPELSHDTSSIEGALTHFLDWAKGSGHSLPDIIVLLQPTSPLRKDHHIRGAVELLIETNADCVLSVSDPLEHPQDMAYWDNDGNMHFLFDGEVTPGITQRQQFQKHYRFTTGGIYAFTRKSFEKSGRRFGQKNIPYPINSLSAIDVDTPEHMKIAEAILRFEAEPT